MVISDVVTDCCIPLDDSPENCHSMRRYIRNALDILSTIAATLGGFQSTSRSSVSDWLMVLVPLISCNRGLDSQLQLAIKVESGACIGERGCIRRASLGSWTWNLIAENSPDRPSRICGNTFKHTLVLAVSGVGTLLRLVSGVQPSRTF